MNEENGGPAPGSDVLELFLKCGIALPGWTFGSAGNGNSDSDGPHRRYAAPF